MAADFIAVHGISPSSQLTLVNFQVRQGYGYQQCVIHVLNSEVRCNMTLITTRCGIALFHVQCSMFTVFTLCVSSTCIVFTLCAIFNVHCVRTLCTLSEMHRFKHLWWGASPHSCGRDTVGRVKTSDSCICATDAAQTYVLTHQGRVSPQGTVFNLCRVIITNKLGHSSRPIPIYRRAARLDWSHYAVLFMRKHCKHEK